MIDDPGGATRVALLRDDGVPVGSAIVEGPALDPADFTRRHGASLPPCGDTVEITIVVCTRDRPALIGRCLDAVGVAIAFAGREVEASVLVVDNASSTDETARTARDRGASVVREAVPGLDVARNRALSAVTSDLVAFIDDDVVVDPAWLRTLARTFAASPDAVAVTGGVLALRLDTPARLAFERAGGFFKGWAAGPVSALRADAPFDPSIGVGCNMALRRDAIRTVGMFDEALDTGPPLAGGGDLDMLIRLAMAGEVIYEPSALVRHDHRETSELLARQYRSWGVSWGAVIHKWYRRSGSEDRARLRRIVVDVVRWYAVDLLVAPTGRIGRRHAARLLGGFVVGLTVAYPRSERRMTRRRRTAGHTPSRATRRRART